MRGAGAVAQGAPCLRRRNWQLNFLVNTIYSHPPAVADVRPSTRRVDTQKKKFLPSSSRMVSRWQSIIGILEIIALKLNAKTTLSLRRLIHTEAVNVTEFASASNTWPSTKVTENSVTEKVTVIWLQKRDVTLALSELSRSKLYYNSPIIPLCCRYMGFYRIEIWAA